MPLSNNHDCHRETENQSDDGDRPVDGSTGSSPALFSLHASEGRKGRRKPAGYGTIHLSGSCRKGLSSRGLQSLVAQFPLSHTSGDGLEDRHGLDAGPLSVCLFSERRVLGAGSERPPSGGRWIREEKLYPDPRIRKIGIFSGKRKIHSLCDRFYDSTVYVLREDYAGPLAGLIW